MTGEVRAVKVDGSVAVLFVIDENGDELGIACEPRMARDIDVALVLGERPIVSFEDWAILFGYRHPPAAVR